MAKKERRSLRVLVHEARSELGMSQREFGNAIGGSHRSAVRWDAGKAAPWGHQLHELARLLYPLDPELAAEVADHDDETLVSLGLEAPPPPPAPPLPPQPPPPPPGPVLRAEDLVDVVVLAAVETSGSLPSSVRPWLHAVFKRAGEVGLSVEAAERALRPPAASPTEERTPGGTRLP